MQLLTMLTQAPLLLAEFDAIDQDWRESYRRYKNVFQDINVEDILFQRKVISKKIAKDIADQQYHYQAGMPRMIKVGKKERLVVPLMITDYVVQRLVCQFLAVRLEKIYSSQCFSYRKGCSSYQAVKQVVNKLQGAELLKNKNKHNDFYVYQTDLVNYTDSIPTDEAAPLWKLIDNMFKQCHLHNLTEYEKSLIYGAILPKVKEGKIKGVPMGSPLTSLVANLYLTQLDHKIQAYANGLYIRYGDDIFFMHPDHNVVLECRNQIIKEVNTLGLTIHRDKEKLTYWTKAGKNRADAVEFKGSSAINLLGYAISAWGTLSLKSGKNKEIIQEVRQRIKSTAHLTRHSGKIKRIKLICEVVNALLQNSNTWLQENKIKSKIDKINDRQVLKQLDFLIALEIAKWVTGIKSVKAFRYLSYRDLRHRYGLISITYIRNKNKDDEI